MEGDARPNSPADVGYVDQAERAPSRAPQHEPKRCGCGAAILWAQVLDESGQRIFYEDARTGRRRVRSMPVDWDPTPAGNVIVFWREGEGFVCRTLKRNECPPPGARPRTSHFATCPNATQHRRKR